MISASTIKMLNNLVGKVCSVVTTMNRGFDPLINKEHFVVLVQEINADGIWGTHPHNDELVSFFAMPHVASIHIEPALDPNNPEHAKMIKDHEEKTGKKVKSDLSQPIAKKKKELPILDKSPAPDVSDAGDAMFVDIESLERLAEDTQRSFKIQTILSEKKQL